MASDMNRVISLQFVMDGNGIYKFLVFSNQLISRPCLI